MTSGAIQYGVPTKELAGDMIEAEPKSAARKQKTHHKVEFNKPKSLLLNESVLL